MREVWAEGEGGGGGNKQNEAVVFNVFTIQLLPAFTAVSGGLFRTHKHP